MFATMMSRRVAPLMVLKNNRHQIVSMRNSAMMTMAHGRSSSSSSYSTDASGEKKKELLIEAVHTKKAPKAVGPYSQAIKVSNASQTLYISGSLGLVPETGNMIDDTTAGQTRQALSNLKNVLEEAGASLDNVVKTLVLLSDMEDFQTVNAIYSEYFNGEIKPARSCFAVKTLPKGAKVEIEAVAVL